jgi:hypothetical protein
MHQDRQPASLREAEDPALQIFARDNKNLFFFGFIALQLTALSFPRKRFPRSPIKPAGAPPAAWAAGPPGTAAPALDSPLRFSI